MATSVYYNENDPFAAAWLRNLITEGLLPDGHVDDRSITEVTPRDIWGFNQCHFFAGIGGWACALQLSCWGDRPVWTGSCPCQPFSLAGAQKGFADERHLWPVWQRLIAKREPPVIFGEQVASAAQWLGLVRSDLEAMGYAVGAIPVEAASAGAYHLRDRYWFVADADLARPQGRPLLPECAGQRPAGTNGVEHADSARRQVDQDAGRSTQRGGAWPLAGSDGASDCWVTGADGKARRVEPGIRLLANGIPNRVGLLRGFGNAIDPRPASAFITAYLTR